MVDFESRLGIYYEHPDWYRPLFAELDRRGVPYDALHADTHQFDPSYVRSPHAVVLNRMSPSAHIAAARISVLHAAIPRAPRSSRGV